MLCVHVRRIGALLSAGNIPLRVIKFYRLIAREWRGDNVYYRGIAFSTKKVVVSIGEKKHRASTF